MLKTGPWRIHQKLLVTFTSLFLLRGAGASSETASPVHELPVSAVLTAREFTPGSELQFSPDGKWIAYAITELPKIHAADTETWLRTGVPWYGRGGQIYIVNIDSGESEQLTSHKGSNWLPTWSRDGRYLAFLSDRDGSGQTKVWIWDSTSNSLQKTSDVSVRGDWIEWTPDRRSVLATTVPRQFSIDAYLNQVLRSAASKGVPTQQHSGSSTATIYESSGGAFGPDSGAMPDPWNLDEKLRDLTLIDIDDGKTTTIIRGRRIAAFLLSPDGSRVAYTSPTHFEKPGSQQIDFELRVVAMGSSADRAVASDIRLEYDGRAFSWSPDGTRLSFRRGGDEEAVGDCYVVDLRQQATRNVSMLPPAHSRSSLGGIKPLWGKDGSQIYFVRDGSLWRALLDQDKATLVTEIPSHQIKQLIATGGNILWATDGGISTIVLTHDGVKKQDGLYRVDLRTGQSSKLLEQGQCYSCTSQNQHVAVSNDGHRLAFLAEDAQQCSDLWVTEFNFQHPHRLTHINPQFDDYEMGKPELIDWLSDDGELLHGALLLPSHYQKGKRYPLIVWVYGGNWLSDHFDHFGLAYGGPFNMQLLATRGYAVLAPDAPQHVGTPMLDLAKSVLPGVNKTIDLGIVDPDHIGIMGHSNGGYSTVALIVQTNRFKAALEISGTADLWSLYGEMGEDGTAFGVSILEHGQDAMGGTPWEFRERYIENSPAFYLDRVETPLLVVQGSEDTGVAPFLGDQLFIALRRLGKEVTYAKYQGEEHSPANWTYVNQVDLCERMIAWFDTHLKKMER